MKRIFLALLTFSLALAAPAQETPGETAKSFMRSGDWDNAILVLTRALQTDPSDISLRKDLAMSYYYKRDYAKAREQAEILLEGDDTDVPTFQIAGNVYKALEEVKAADKMYKKALKKFPKSGPLYSEYGELLWARQDYNAITHWEKGIQVDPSYAGNYYNAALFYYYTKDKVWTLIYGEIFVNMEYLTERATQMKKILLSTYKEKLFADVDINKDQKNATPFARAVLQNFNAQSALVARGINTETLNMMRTKFIFDWFNQYGAKFPFRLFDYHQQLIREGMFEAYNQWLFGTVENLPSYDQWTKTNNEAYSKFASFQKGRVFKMPAGQFYGEK